MTPPATTRAAKAPPQLDIHNAGTPPDPAASVPLAMPFAGCWQGTIARADSIEQIGFFTVILPRQEYRFCYLPDSKDENSIILSRLVVNGGEVVPTEFEDQIVWTDGKVAYMRTHIASDATQWLLFVPITYREEVYVDEDVTLENPNLIKMRGVELIRLRGNDYARASFHADFHRVPRP